MPIDFGRGVRHARRSLRSADSQKAAGKHGPDLYIVSFVVMIALLVVGLTCNELIRQVAPKHHEPAPLDEALLAPETVSHLQPEKQP